LNGTYGAPSLNHGSINVAVGHFDKAMRTASGTVPAATTVLRDVRVGRISIGDVRAAVIANAPQSVLGMSFLSRLKSFEMQRDRLTLSW